MARGGRRRSRSVPRRRRKRPSGAAKGSSVLEEMSSRGRQRSLQTLAPDGTILEELIRQMQDEYGTPATPQEYRLLVKVAAKDELKDPTPPPTGDVAVPMSQSPEGEQPPPRSRRRGRRRSRSRKPRDSTH